VTGVLEGSSGTWLDREVESDRLAVPAVDQLRTGGPLGYGAHPI
jgi:hypothetical protein